MPLYLASFAGWAALARLMMPLKYRIPGKIEFKGPLVRWSHFIIILFAVSGLGAASSALVPVAYAVVGWLISEVAFVAYEFGWNDRLKYCPTCQRRIAFRRYKGKFYCEKCGSDATTV